MNNALAGIALGGATGSALLAADLVTASSLQLRDALALVVFVAGLVWWMGRKFQRIEDKLDDHSERITKLPCKEVEKVVKKVGNKLQCEE